MQVEGIKSNNENYTKEYLCETIILIANNHDIKELIAQYKGKMFTSNYNLKGMVKEFLIDNDSDFVNKVKNVITNDNELSERILTLEIMNNEIISNQPPEHPIICGLLIIIFTPIVNILNDLLDRYENNPILYSIYSTINLFVSAIYIILAAYFDCGISPY